MHWLDLDAPEDRLLGRCLRRQAEAMRPAGVSREHSTQARPVGKEGWMTIWRKPGAPGRMPPRCEKNVASGPANIAWLCVCMLPP